MITSALAQRTAVAAAPHAASGPEANHAQAREAAAPKTARLVIELDEASARFVRTLIDNESASVLRRYPSDGQIEFSRGVAAYLAAIQRAGKT
jgi:hypothetical protein